MRSGKVRRRISGLVIVVATALIAAVAVSYQGYPTADVKLNDGGVWVSRSIEARIGHLNYPSRLLDGATPVPPTPYDLLQDGNDIATYDSTTGKLDPLDPATMVFKQGVAFAPGSRVSARGGSIGVIDAEADGLYVTAAKDIGGFSAAGREPLALLGKGSVVAVGTQGAAYAVSLKGELVTVPGAKGQATTAQLGAFKDKAVLQLTAVGDTPVVLDQTNGIAYFNGKSVDLPEAKNGRLQAASAANDSVLIAGPAGLIVQPLDGGKATVESVPQGGTPAQPVWVQGCGYAVWSGTAAYVRVCANPADKRNEVIKDAGSQPSLILRQNRNVVVVNELTLGMIWLANDNLQLVNNWQDVIDQTKDGDKQAKQKQLSFQLPKREKQNHRPVAKPDNRGIRLGETTVLPVLDNDTDEDGDLLAASLVEGTAPDGVHVQTVSSGAALQVRVDENYQSTSAKFEYQVNDGRENGTAKASVTLAIAPRGVNSAPEQPGTPQKVMLELGATANFDALIGWKDADGDDLYLTGASSVKGDRIVYRNNGMIQFTEGSGEAGVHEVTLEVSDGKDSKQGKLLVDVRPKDSLAPIANADRYSTTVGDTLTIAPLANDLSTSGKELRLARIDDKVADVRTNLDTAGNTFSFESTKAGTYYVQYLVSQGTKAADGIVRIDVHPKDGGDLDPLATRDVALVAPGQQALVDVLANDTDPSGGILVVQRVTVPNGARASAEVLEHRVLRIGDAGLDDPVTLSYQVCSGKRCSTGEVRVIPVKRTDNKAAPVAQPDNAVVRAGDIVTVDVTRNDYHPAGDSIVLLPDLKEVPDAANGTAFVSEGKVRFRANDDPKDDRVDIVYEVRDSKDHITSGLLRVDVLPADAERNQEPKPKSVTARTIGGTSVRIPIPLDGIDPDGDSVELVGVATPPKKGRVTVGDSWLTYEAYADSSGSDSFGYRVRDRLGAMATGTAVVGVAQPSNQNQAPYAVRDEVVVRPGRSVSVPVLTNDSDPDGDQVALVANGLKVPSGVTANVVKSRIVVEAPQAAGNYSIGYTAVDDFGARAAGTLVVTVDPQAPLQAPLARDDRVQPVQLTGGTVVDVPVLDNDEDPDGVAEKLAVTTDSPNAAPGAPGVLKVTLTPKPQLIMYTVTDVDQQSASAVIFVPGTDALLPTVKSMPPLDVVAGKELRVSLADLVLVRAGRTPRVAEADTVRAAHGATGVVDQSTLSYTSAADYPYGPDAIAVQVTDGEGPDDPKGNQAYLSIPIRVLPAENLPPSLKESRTAVVPGEEPVEINLAKLASDPNPEDAGQLSFVPSAPAGFQARVEGARLFVSADAALKPGQEVVVPVEVADPRGAKGLGQVTVLVTRSQRGLPVAVDDALGQAEQGRTVGVDVLRNDVNPFADDGKPLTLVSARVVAGDGGVTVSGGKLDVTPDAHFVGTMEISYRIQDAVERNAEGTLRVTVQGAPDQVNRPLVLTAGNRTVVLQWTTPEHNGRPITGYTVTSRVDGFSQKCATTTCTLKGLTNNKEYTFQVVATNAIGDSEPSAPSAVARPDTRPDTPGAPTLEFGDGEVKVNWKTPHSDGSPVLSYNLEISPSPRVGGLQMSGVTGTSTVWKGLQNGTAYQVRVQAVNSAPDPSGWSPWSRSEVPAGKPDAPGQPRADAAKPVGDQAQIAVTWPAVSGEAANGDAVKTYTLRYSNGGTTREVATSSTRQNVTLATSTSDYTFSVKATNKAGDSGWSEVSEPRRSAIPPEAVKNVRADPGDQRVTLNFSRLTAAELNGTRSDEVSYYYRRAGAGGSGTRIAPGGTIDGLRNGDSYAFEVWAKSSVPGVADGPATRSNAAVPFGRPIISNVQDHPGDNSINFTWTVDANGADITSCDGMPDGCDTGNRSWTKTGLSQGQSWSQSWTYRNKAGSAELRLSGRTNEPPPPPSVGLYNAGYQGECTVGSAGPCYFVGVRTRNFSGSVTCTIDGGYATRYGANDDKRIGGPSYPSRGLNINIVINCGGVQWSGRMPRP